jgi:hypothetical protein
MPREVVSLNDLCTQDPERARMREAVGGSHERLGGVRSEGRAAEKVDARVAAPYHKFVGRAF